MSDRTVTHETFVVERTYGASPDRVFAAWAEPEAKKRWFATAEDWETSEFELDLRVGGEERFRSRTARGPVMSYRATFLDIVEGQRIVYTYEMHRDDDRISVSLATVELGAAGGGTHLIFTEQGAFLDGRDAPTQREQGMGTLLDALGDEVERES